MKALSLWQPHASLIALELKTFETRSWTTDYRGPLVIHAAKRWTLDQLVFALSFPASNLLEAAGYANSDDIPLGAGLCLCDLVDIIPTSLLINQITDHERAFGDFSRGRYAWHLVNVRRFETPIPARGAQGLWDWRLPLP